jgi:hypothetical protein
MAKFDFMEFGYNAGSFDQLVFHAKKYTKEQAVEIFNEEYAYKGLKATVDDVSEGYVKYFIHPTEDMSSDWEGGCYGFVDKQGNGAFPVLVLTLSELDFVD